MKPDYRKQSVNVTSDTNLTSRPDWGQQNLALGVKSGLNSMEDARKRDSISAAKQARIPRSAR